MHRGRQSRAPRRSARWWWTLVAFFGSVTLLGAAAYLYVRPIYYTPKSIGRIPAASPAPPSRTAGTAQSQRTTQTAAVGVPTALVLPALGISARVVPEGLVTKVTNPLDGPVGSLQIPNDPHLLGWWKYGAAPGDPDGTVVVAGHVDTAAAGDGALFHLAAAEPGQTITIHTTTGPVTYTVAARHTYLKADLPPAIFTRSGRPRLVVITCGGPFNWATHHYADNIVVYAPLQPRPAPQPADAPPA